MNITASHKQIRKSCEWMPSVFMCIAKQSLTTGQRQEEKQIAMPIYGCSNILQFSPELHSYDNPSFTKLLIISINGGQIAVQTEGDFIISSFSQKNKCWCLFTKDREIRIIIYFLSRVVWFCFWDKKLENPNYQNDNFMDFHF